MWGQKRRPTWGKGNGLPRKFTFLVEKKKGLLRNDSRGEKKQLLQNVEMVLPNPTKPALIMGRKPGVAVVGAPAPPYQTFGGMQERGKECDTHSRQ